MFTTAENCMEKWIILNLFTTAENCMEKWIIL